MVADLGTDIACVSDLDATGVEVSGRTALAHAIARRLTTPRGRLIDDANYGIDLRDYLNDDMGPAQLASVKTAIEAECKKDERVLDLTATVSLLAGVMTIAIVVTDALGPFTLVLGVSTLTVSLLQVSQ